MSLKKISILFLIIVLWGSFIGKAQIPDHLKGVQGVNIGCGLGDREFVVEMGYYRWVGNALFVKGKIYISQSFSEAVSGFTVSRYGLDVNLCYNFFKLKDKFYLNLFAGMGTEWNDVKINEGVFEDKDKMKFGVIAGIEVEVRLYKRLLAVLYSNPHYMFGKELGAWRVYGMLGLRYSF